MLISKGAVNRILLCGLLGTALPYPAGAAKIRAGFFLAELKDGEAIAVAKAENGSLAPVGSLLKPFAAWYLLERGLDAKHTILCPPERKRSDELRCWTPAGHGATDLSGALAQSCNYYFLSLFRGQNLTSYEAWLREKFEWPEMLRITKPVHVYGYDLPSGIAPAKLAHMYARLWNAREAGNAHAVRVATGLKGVCEGTMQEFCHAFAKQNQYEMLLGKTGTVHEGSQPYGIAAIIVRNKKTNRKLLLLCYEHRKTGAQAALNALRIFNQYKP